ncbi:MAG TPA: hypothetical protein DDY20_06310 [Desulfobulbaceae bacterium]|nr:hypothetical protein [Desulfobulbaceae bacterium]
MQTLYEKITFILTGMVYVLFHLGKAPGNGSLAVGTVMALLNTLPYEIAITYLIVVFIRRTTGQRPPWDRILRIFFTVGIIFGLIYGLYVRGALEQERQQGQQVTVVCCGQDDSRNAPWHWA